MGDKFAEFLQVYFSKPDSPSQTTIADQVNISIGYLSRIIMKSQPVNRGSFNSGPGLPADGNRTQAQVFKLLILYVVWSVVGGLIPFGYQFSR